jgi:hypothetical protein
MKDGVHAVRKAVLSEGMYKVAPSDQAQALGFCRTSTSFQGRALDMNVAHAAIDSHHQLQKTAWSWE